MSWEYAVGAMMGLPGLVCLWITWGQQRAIDAELRRQQERLE